MLLTSLYLLNVCRWLGTEQMVRVNTAWQQHVWPGLMQEESEEDLPSCAGGEPVSLVDGEGHFFKPLQVSLGPPCMRTEWYLGCPSPDR